MSGKPQQIRNTALYQLPIVIGNLVPIITLPILTRLLSAEDFGAWALASAYASVIGGIAAVGLPVTFDRNLFEHSGKEGRTRLLHLVVGLTLVSIGLCVALMWLFRAPVTARLIGKPTDQSLVF